MTNSKGLENIGTGGKQRAQKNKLIVNYWSAREYNIRSYKNTILALRKAVVAKPRGKEPSKIATYCGFRKLLLSILKQVVQV